MYEPRTKKQGGAKGPVRILVVEPVRSIRGLLEIALRQGGYEVVAVAEALAAVRAFASCPFDKVVVGSPVVLESGEETRLFLEVMVQLRGTLDFCLVVLTTHVVDRRVLGAASRAGACAVLAKPFDMEHFLAEIAVCVDGNHTPTRWSGIPEAAIDAI